MDAIDYVREDILEIKKEHTLLIEKIQKTFELFHDDIKKTREQQNLIVQNLTEKGNDIQFLAAQFQFYKRDLQENNLSVYHNKQDIVDLKEDVDLLNDDIKDVQDGLNSLDSQMRNYSIDVANSHGLFLKKSDEITKNIRETQDALKSHIEFTKEELRNVNIRISDGYAKLAVKIEELEARVDVHSHFCRDHQFMLRKIYPFECYKCGKEVKNPTDALLSFPPKYECEPSCDKKPEFKEGDFWRLNNGEIVKIIPPLGIKEPGRERVLNRKLSQSFWPHENFKEKVEVTDWPFDKPEFKVGDFWKFSNDDILKIREIGKSKNIIYFDFSPTKRTKIPPQCDIAYYIDRNICTSTCGEFEFIPIKKLDIIGWPSEKPEFKVGQVWEFYNEPTENHNDTINNGDKLLILSMKENIDAIIVTLQNSETTHLIMKNNLKYYCSNQSLNDFPLIPNPNYKGEK